jgi:ribosomal protein S18 acetylase RimI-like enzyme
MTVRPARPSDTARVLELLSQVLELHASIRPDVFVSGTTKYQKEELEAIFANSATPVFVAEDESEVVGYAFCTVKDAPAKKYVVPSTTLYIDDLCVDSAHRKGGVGKALFDCVCAKAHELGCSGVTLNVWEGNDPARRFYEKMGMKPRSTQMELLF